MESQNFKEMLSRLKDNQCSKEEIESLYNSLSEMPEDLMNETLEALFYHDKHTSALTKTDSERIYENISRHQELNLHKRRRLYGALSIATFLALLIAGYFIYKNYIQVTTITSDYAQQKNIELPDGSIVRLNANSRLKYEKNWNDHDVREVYIEGEAFFNVMKNPVNNQKFIVRTKDLSIVVHGTEFNVNTRDDKTSVYLEEGSISLELNKKNEIKEMIPGDKIEYSSKDKKILISEKDIKPTLETSWKDGVLNFEETKLKEVLKELESIYGINIKTEGDVDMNKLITAGIPMKELEIVIPLLSGVLDREIKREGNQIIILSQ